MCFYSNGTTCSKVPAFPLTFASVKLYVNTQNIVFVTQVHARLGGCLGPANPDNFQSRWSTAHLLCTPLNPAHYKMVFSTKVSAYCSQCTGMGAGEMEVITRNRVSSMEFLSVETPSSLDEEGAYDKTGAETACVTPVWVCLERKVSAPHFSTRAKALSLKRQAK